MFNAPARLQADYGGAQQYVEWNDNSNASTVSEFYQNPTYQASPPAFSAWRTLLFRLPSEPTASLQLLMLTIEPAAGGSTAVALLS